jgi:hypothetical protein
MAKPQMDWDESPLFDHSYQKLIGKWNWVVEMPMKLSRSVISDISLPELKPSCWNYKNEDSLVHAKMHSLTITSISK